MSETEIMGEEYKNTLEYYTEKIRRELQNENLAQALETATPSDLANEHYIKSKKQSFPEAKETLETLQEEIIELQQNEKEAYDWTKYFTDPQKKTAKGFKHAQLGKDIMKNFEFKKLRDSEQIWVYKNGYYQSKGQQIIEEECSKRLGPEYKESRYKDVKSWIEAKVYIKRKNFKPPKNKICLRNGVYDLEKEKLIDHKPSFYFRHQIPVKYNPDAECPEIHSFLKEIVQSEEQVKTLREIAGYSLLPSYPLNKAFMLIGKGSNGKSLYLDLLKNLLGEENYINKSLQELEDNQYASSKLVGKLACIDDDLPSDKLRRTSRLKKLTGGSDIGAEIKYGDQFDFDNFAKFIFACNELPRTNDTSDGFYRRWVLVEFPYKFKENPDPENPKEKQSRPKEEIIQAVTDQEELEGFLWWAIEALKDVKNLNAFTYQSSTQQVREKWKEYSEPLAQFVHKYVEQGIGKRQVNDKDKEAKKSNESLNDFGFDYIRKDFLKKVIGDYCEARSHSRPSKKSIKEELESQGFYFNPKGRTRREPEDKRVRVYTGLRMKYPDPEKCPGVPTYSSTFTHVCACAQEKYSNQSLDVGTPPNDSLENDEEKKDSSDIPDNRIRKVKEGIKELEDGNNSVDVEDLISYVVRNSRMLEEEVESIIDKKKSEGEFYEPSPGSLGLI